MDSCLADLSQMEAVTCAREDGDPCLSTASSRRREVGLARRAAAAEAQAVTADAFLSTAPSSIYMWAYTGENIFSSSSSKIFPGVISHMVLKGGVQGFNISIYFQN